MMEETLSSPFSVQIRREDGNRELGSHLVSVLGSAGKLGDER